jgi:hypothetical protein
LHPHVPGTLLQQPTPQLLERTRGDQGVEQHHAPECDPIDVPHAGRGAVGIGAHALGQRHLPNPQRQQKGDDRADEHGKPGRHTQAGKQKQQQQDWNERDKPSDEQVARRIEDLREHFAFSPVAGAGERRFSGREPPDMKPTNFFVTRATLGEFAAKGYGMQRKIGGALRIAKVRHIAAQPHRSGRRAILLIT